MIKLRYEYSKSLFAILPTIVVLDNRLPVCAAISFMRHTIYVLNI